MKAKRMNTKLVLSAAAAVCSLAASAAGIVGAGVVSQEVPVSRGAVASANGVSVICPKPKDWSFALEQISAEGELREYSLRLTSPVKAEPPEFTLEVSSPKNDMQHLWTPIFGCPGRIVMAEWTKWFAVQRTLPLVVRFNGNDRNRVLVSVGEVRKDLVVEQGVSEEDISVKDRFSFFRGVKDACTAYEVRIRVDRRDVFWSAAVEDAVKWISRVAKVGPPMPAPAAAFKPLYSTWYNHHHDIDAEKVERELRIAADLGMETVILDAGWEADDAQADGLSSCGDWAVSKKRFPDMAAHVKRVHDLGLKYMVWFSVPFAGKDTEARRRFAGKFLYAFGKKETAVFDPRFPEVREYLIATYERCLREWDLDGFKLDFVDQIETRDKPDPAEAEKFAGRDCRTIPEGVEKLMTAVAARLRAIKPDVLIEFRSAYVGPVMQACGNMMRVADCPAQLAANRVGTVNLRLVCPHSAVHADMIKWNDGDTPEQAARYVLSSIFGVVQYSVVLEKLSPRHAQMLRHWIGFTKQHENALLHGAIVPHHAERDYSVVEGVSADERIVLASNAGELVEIAMDRPSYVLNNTGADEILIRLDAEGEAKVFDTYGRFVRKVRLSRGLNGLAVPASGLVELSR